MSRSIVDARGLFSPDGTYLNTASYGLPPSTALVELAAAVDGWRRGAVSPPDYDGWVTRGRAAFGRIVGVPESWVSIGTLVSPFVGLVAAALPAGARVICAEGEFTSVLFPFLAHADRGVETIVVPLESIPDRMDDSISLVAVSSVQSADGRVADLDAIADAAARHSIRTLIDATQSCGWKSIDATRFDHVVVGAYKWLLSPRGTAFMTVRPDFVEHLRPIHAGWYAGDRPWEAIYDPPLRLAADARRFDTSPAWLNWVGTAIALELLEEVGIEAIEAHNLGLSRLAAERLGRPEPSSAILSLPIDGASAALAASGVAAATRAGAVRVSFHLYNDESDVEALGSALG